MKGVDAMANYDGFCRSNYVRIKPDKVKELEEFCGKTGLVCETKQIDGETFYGFHMDYGEGIPNYYFIDYNDQPASEEEVDWGKDFAPFLEEGEVFQISEIGNEKLRFLVGYSIWIQSNGKVHSTNIHEPPHWAKKFAKKYGKSITDNAY